MTQCHTITYPQTRPKPKNSSSPLEFPFLPFTATAAFPPISTPLRVIHQVGWNAIMPRHSQLRAWSDLPLLTILFHLDSPADFTSFVRVCRWWRAVGKEHERDFMCSLPPMFFTDPLIHSVKDGRVHRLRRADGESVFGRYAAKFIAASHGYLIYYRFLPDSEGRNCCHIFLLNPFTGKEASFPPVYERLPFIGGALTAPLTSLDCMLVLVTGSCIQYCHAGEARFQVFSHKQWIPAKVAVLGTSVYFFDSRQGVDFIKRVDLVPEPKVTGLEVWRTAPVGPGICFFESDGGIFGIWGYYMRRNVSLAVYRLDLSEVRWVLVENLGDRTVFVDCRLRGVADRTNKWEFAGEHHISFVRNFSWYKERKKKEGSKYYTWYTNAVVLVPSHCFEE